LRRDSRPRLSKAEQSSAAACGHGNLGFAIEYEQRAPAVSSSTLFKINDAQRKSMPIAQDDVLNALKQCYDPEIPVNIVDLGLIYEIRFDDVPEGQQDVTVDMTLTAQGCPEHVNISAQVKSRVEQLPGVRNANVNVIWEPAWTPERLSPEARKQLGIE
jgi:metal-sulfur cluster biosynthetic enzyme